MALQLGDATRDEIEAALKDDTGDFAGLTSLRDSMASFDGRGAPDNFLDEETRSMLSELSQKDEAHFAGKEAKAKGSDDVVVQVTIPTGTPPNSEFHAETPSGVRLRATTPADHLASMPDRIIQLAVPRSTPPGAVVRAMTPAGYGIRALVPENWIRSRRRRRSSVLDKLINPIVPTRVVSPAMAAALAEGDDDAKEAPEDAKEEEEEEEGGGDIAEQNGQSEP